MFPWVRDRDNTMGSVKAAWMEYMENESMYEWIEENYGDDVGEEGSDEWNAAVQDFQNYCDEQERLARESREEDEYDYYLYLTLGDVDKIFSKEISNLKTLLKSSQSVSNSSTLYKMIYAHAVTILEVYLEDMIKALIVSNGNFLKNTIRNVRPFSDSKFKLSEISLEQDGIKKFVLLKLTENLFHDIPKVINLYSGLLEKKIVIDIERICTVTGIRHDIVHRNGKNKDGADLVISESVAESAIEIVETFAMDLRHAL